MNQRLMTLISFRRTFAATLMLVCSMFGALSVSAGQGNPQPKPKDIYGYLYCHMSRDGEWTAFALSRDGIHWHDLNKGREVYDTRKISEIEGGARDAYITRAADGHSFVMLTTDMCVARSRKWDNYGMNLLRSDDLIHWTACTFDFRKGPQIFCNPESPDVYKDYSTIRRVWAPQAIWDPTYRWKDGTRGGYFIYYSLLNDKEEGYDRMYYSYADRSFTRLTKPRLLFDWGYATIDADINYVRADGKYHMLIKKEGGKPGIFTTKAKKLTGPWPQPDDNDFVSFEGKRKCEGSSAFQIAGDDGWRVGYVEYSSRPARYRICKADKYLSHFNSPQDIIGVAAPQHGSFMALTKDEYERLDNYWRQYDSVATRNPVLPEFHADPEILFSDGKYYIYSTTDGFPQWGGTFFTCYSSADMKNWTYEGVPFDVTRDTRWAKGNAWAPAAVEKNGKYYLYYSADDGKGKAIGVAVADRPDGRFTDSGHPLVTTDPSGHRGGHVIDVDVFTDDDGQSYLYWGNGFMAVAKLNSDMTSIDTTGVKVITPRGGTLDDYAFREGTYVFKRNGKYYFMWSVDDTGSRNYHVAYGTADSPMGPITVARQPIVLRQRPMDGIYGTAHNAVVEDPRSGRWFIVYHRINESYLKTVPGTHREVCIDELHFRPDGSIIEVVPSR